MTPAKINPDAIVRAIEAISAADSALDAVRPALRLGDEADWAMSETMARWYGYTLVVLEWLRARVPDEDNTPASGWSSNNPTE
jgi:hypothetical protein